MLVSTNDSRIRILDLETLELVSKLKGHRSVKLECLISTRFSPDGECVISGSEDNHIYIWDQHDQVPDDNPDQTRKRKNDTYECFKGFLYPICFC